MRCELPLIARIDWSQPWLRHLQEPGERVAKSSAAGLPLHQALGMIPATAILHADNQPMVYVKTGELTFSRIDVKLGVRQSGFVQIDAMDLKPGLEIVSQGSHVLKSEWILNHVASAAP